jgi:hypothetical protein
MLGLGEGAGEGVGKGIICSTQHESYVTCEMSLQQEAGCCAFVHA